VIEDDCCARKVLCEQLRHWHANVDALTVSQLLTHDAAHCNYELIFIDNNASDEVDTDLARVLRDIPEYAQTKLVAMVPMDFETETLNSTSQEFDAFVFKPIIYTDLIEVIKLFDNPKAVVNNNPNSDSPQQSDVSSKESSTAQSRVLLVEDNHINQQVARALLENLDLHCDIATNGQEAIDALLMAPKATPYDAVIMDCQMPVMDGYTATEQIRQGKASQSYQDIPIIALTANAMTTDRETCLNAGMNDYLSKPIKAEQLAETLQKWL
jgi:CheY-like chemotaxis protein